MKRNNCHVYDVDDACEHGVHEAVILYYFRLWLRSNKANNRNIYDGRVWSYNTLQAICDQLPELTDNQVRHCIKKLTDKGKLIKGNYNKMKYDRTLWYSVDEPEFVSNGGDTDQNSSREISPIHLGNFTNGEGTSPEPIPDSYTDNETNNKTHTKGDDEFHEVIKYWNETHGTAIRPTKSKQAQFKQRLKTFSIDEIKTAILNRSESDYIRGDGANHVANWSSLFRNDDQIDKYLNMRRSSEKAPEIEKELPKYVPAGGFYYAGGK